MKFKIFFYIVFLYVFTLTFVYLIHINFFRVDVVFYSAILDAVIAAFLVLLVVCMFGLFPAFDYFDKFQVLIVLLLIGYAFAISVPTVIDRSLSFYILEKIDQRGGGIKLSSLEDVFVKEYMPEHRLIDVRITEQLSSGTIVVDNGCVKTTERGKFLASFSRYFRNNFLPKKRLLNDDYTSDLTDPFANSAVSDHTNFEYICE